jgi:hypothetical protein
MMGRLFSLNSLGNPTRKRGICCRNLAHASSHQDRGELEALAKPLEIVYRLKA